METTTETIEILNDLLAISNDRIRGYEIAIEQVPANDNALKTAFAAIISETQAIRVTLVNKVKRMGIDLQSIAAGSGRIYRAWLDVKSISHGQDRHALLVYSENLEQATQRAYRVALLGDFPGYIRDLLVRQQQILKTTHDTIKKMADSDNR